MSDQWLQMIQGNAQATQYNGLGQPVQQPQPQDLLAANLVGNFQQNPKYAELNRAVGQSRPISVGFDPTLLDRRGGTGLSDPGSRQIYLEPFPVGAATPQERASASTQTLAHELGHQLTSEAIPLYDAPQYQANLPYADRPQEQIATRLEQGSKRKLPPPPPNASEKQLAEWRKKNNIEGLVEMLMRYSPQGKY